MGNVVLLERQQGLAIVTLNRPDALNALSLELRNALTQTFTSLAADPSCEVIILTGAGRAFTVGLDLKELGGGKASAEAADGDVAEAMRATPQPIIGAVNGYAITGGFELALLCDFLIAAPDARFADTHGRVGVVPGWGLSQRLPRLIGINRAKELSLTGNFLEAEQALAWGLINRIVPADELLPVCVGLANDIMTTEPETRAEIRRIMDAGWETTLGDGITLEREASHAHARQEGANRAKKVAERREAIQARGRHQTGV